MRGADGICIFDGSSVILSTGKAVFKYAVDVV